MMVLSAFVAIPTYNVGANEHEDGEDHDDGDHDDGDHDDHGDEEEPRFTHFNGKMVMESLGVWNITGEGQYDAAMSDEQRQDIAQLCEYMLGTVAGTITKECFDYLLEMDDDSEDHDDFHCPAAMDDETCEIMEECNEDSHDGNITCTKTMYDYCKGDGSSDMMMCGPFNQMVNQECHDDEGNQETCPSSLLWSAFDYENGEITASEFVDAFMDIYGVWLEEINKHVILKATPFEDVYHITEENKSNSYLVDLNFRNLNVSNNLNYSWQITQLEMICYDMREHEVKSDFTNKLECEDAEYDWLPNPSSYPIWFEPPMNITSDQLNADGTYFGSALIMPYWNASSEWTNGCYEFEAHAMNGLNSGAHDDFIFGVGNNSAHCHMMNDKHDHDDDGDYNMETILAGYMAYDSGDMTEAAFATNMTELIYVMFSQGDDDEGGHHHHGDEDYHHDHNDDDGLSHADYDRHHNHDHDGGDNGDHDHGDDGDHHDHGDHDDDGDHDDHDHGDHDDHDYLCYDNEEHNMEFQFHNKHDCEEAGFMWVHCNTGPAGTCEALHAYRDDDEPMILDGIEGVQNPEDPDCEILPDFVSGSVADNAGKSITCSIGFTVTFEGADDTLAQHKATIPFDNETEWHLDIEMLEGYEFISCEGCESSTFTDNKGNIKAFDTVNITFGKVVEQEPEPVLPDCDVTIGIDDANYAFNPISVEIKFGQTVCWQWTNSTEPHNVAQVAESADTTKLSSGFYSGEAVKTEDFRVTFDAAGGYSDDTSYYYICEPHVSMKMVGEIVVGTGSTDPAIEEAADEVPSIGFIAGILVLVGAAGLRRRIH